MLLGLPVDIHDVFAVRFVIAFIDVVVQEFVIFLLFQGIDVSCFVCFDNDIIAFPNFVLEFA